MFDDLIPQGQPNVTVRPSRGERNMNPGNIEDGPFARSQPGYSGSDGRFARFESAENGMAAIDALLSSYGRRGFDSPDAIINRWAPPSDNNPTRNYSAYVAEGLGVDPSARLDMNDPNVRRQVAERIAQFETGKRQPANATPIPAQTRALSFDDLIPQQPQEQTEGRPNVTIRPTPQQTVSAGSALAGGVAQGVSLNFYDELRGLMEAGGLDPKDPASLTTLLQGAYKYWSGDPEATQRYDAATGRERQVLQQAQEQQPVASIAGNVLGAVALPIGGALQAATLPGRIGRGAAVGAGAGAAYGAGEGSGLEDRASRAAVGGALGAGVGAVAPVALKSVELAGQGIAAAARPITTSIRGMRDPEAEAARRVVTGLRRDAAAGDAGLSPAEFAAARASGTPVAMVDAGGSTTRALARSSANTSPEARGALERLTSDRFETQGSRAVDFVTNLVRTPANAGVTRDALEDAARKFRKPFYDRAYRDGSGGIWDNELKSMMDNAPVMQTAAKEAIASIQNKVASGRAMSPVSPSGSPTLEFWDQVKRSLDSKYNVLKRAGDTEGMADVQALRSRLIGKLDTAVPSYATARGLAAEFFKASNALEAGEKFLTSGKIHDVRKLWSKMHREERDLFAEGFVSAFVDKISKVGDRRTILNQIQQSADARERFNIALGPQKAKELEAFLRVENIMDRMRGALGNSSTARQLVEAGLAGGAATGYTGDLQSGASVAGMWFALRQGGKILNQRVDQNVARRVGEMLASDDPKVLQKGLKVVSGSPVLMKLLRAADDQAAKIGGQEVPSGSVSLQSMGTGRADEEQPGVPRPRGQ